jgi:hypothetical protein
MAITILIDLYLLYIFFSSRGALSLSPSFFTSRVFEICLGCVLGAAGIALLIHGVFGKF